MRHSDRPSVSIQAPPDPTASLEDEAKQIRRVVIQALFEVGGGHYGGCLSVVEILLVLYRKLMRVNPEIPSHPERDRLILSKGHAVLTQYVILQRLGFFAEPLSGYGAFERRLEGHPDMLVTPGIDFSTGSLGQGLSVGLGMAIGLGDAGPTVWVVLGDGECQEGQVWEAAMLAEALSVSNIIAVIDFNGYQEWGLANVQGNSRRESSTKLEQKWRSFGWKVLRCNGHSCQRLHEAYSAAVNNNAPTAIIAETVKGNGAGLMLADPQRFHCTTVLANEHHQILADLK